MTAAVAAAAPASPPSLGMPLVASAVLHAALIVAFLALRPARARVQPPIYRVNIIAAAPGQAQAGVITPTAPVADQPAPPRPKTEDVTPVPAKATPKRTPRLATPNVADTRTNRHAPAPTAAGGAQGGRGTDVANIRTEGIDFPYPGYLENIVRQIALVFHPPRGSPLKAEVMFLIRRDGSISGFQFTQRSGSFTFDLEAQGAVEAAAHKFGPLPGGFRDDVLPVFFSFDPRLIH